MNRHSKPCIALDSANNQIDESQNVRVVLHQMGAARGLLGAVCGLQVLQ